MNFAIIGSTITLIGEITIAYTVATVHHRFMKEHKVDEEVFKAMEKEQIYAVLGIMLLVIGYILNTIAQLQQN